MNDISITEQQIINFEIQPSSETMCTLKILVQPVETFRFRYESEMKGTHGNLTGEFEYGNEKKTFPTVRLINCPDQKAVIRCSIVTADEDRRSPHVHRLVRKNGNENYDDPHDIEVTVKNNYEAMFDNMGIIQTRKKDMEEVIVKKKETALLKEKRRKNEKNTTVTALENLQIITEAEEEKKGMDLNKVALCFQGFRYRDDGVLHPITEKVYSRTINNKKNVDTGDITLCRISKNYSSCKGGKEIWLLVDKVDKQNIRVQLYELDEKDNLIWEADGKFTELDVHHQYAIVFTAPPYKDVDIVEPKNVFIRLQRPSDGKVSNRKSFVYNPSVEAIYRKRPRIDTKTSEFFPETTPSLEECVPLGETSFNLDLEEFSSVELEKLIEENSNAASEDVEDIFFSNIPEIEECLSLPNSNLSFDGAAVKSHETVATSTIKRVIETIKEARFNVDKEMAMSKLENLSLKDNPVHSDLRSKVTKSIIETIEKKNFVSQPSAIVNGTGEILKKLGIDPSFRNNIGKEEDAIVPQKESEISLRQGELFDPARDDSKIVHKTGGKSYVESLNKNRQGLERTRQKEEKLTDAHVKRITEILDKTGGWIELAEHMNLCSLVKFYEKTTSPSSALINRIRLQEPDISVAKVKKILIEVNAFEAASALEEDICLKVMNKV